VLADVHSVLLGRWPDPAEQQPATRGPVSGLAAAAKEQERMHQVRLPA